jgi:SAM-dependent methyltransferase
MSQVENPLAKASYAYQRSFTTGTRGVLARSLPRPLLRALNYLLLSAMDGVDVVLGRRRELVPPRHLNFVGDGDFEAKGDEFLRYFVDLARVTPKNKVLDVGCGVGRMARPLTKYLVGGSYEGIDIVPEGVRWCQREISIRYPNFRFQVADVHNVRYNPRGRFRPTQYELPFRNCEFDFTFLTSVFTHMQRPEMEHYLGEIARTLRPGGKCLITFFLLNEESLELMRMGRSALDFHFALDGCYTDDERRPEHAVAFEEAHIRALYRDLGFMVETVRYGNWCGRSNYLSYQDIVVARKI